MNPARSIGPALVWNEYKGLWIYILGPTIGAIGGAWAYNTLRFTDKPLNEKTEGTTGISTMTYEVVMSLFKCKNFLVYLHETMYS